MASARHFAACICACAALATPVHASDKQQAEARTLFESGRQLYVADRFQEAYDAFKRAYLLAPKPEFLYNMASALQSLGRPHEAAEELRGYLRATPDATDRVAVEARIRGLEEAQRLLGPVVTPRAPATPTAPSSSPTPLDVTAPVDVTAAPRPEHGWTRRKTAIVVGASIGAILIGAGIGLGLGFGLRDPHSGSTFGVKTVTE